MELAAVAVQVDGVELALGAALGRTPHNLVHPLWGVVAVWDADRSRHIINWELMSVLVDPAGPDDWVRRQLLQDTESGQPLDWDLIGAVLECHPHFAERTLAREQGGRVRAGDDGGWIAEHGPVERPIPVASRLTIPAALAALENSCMAARAELRHVLGRSDDAQLRCVARATWWAPRYQLWATTDDVSRTRTWDLADVVTMLDLGSALDVSTGRAHLPPPDQVGDGGVDARWYQETVISWALSHGFSISTNRSGDRSDR